MKFLLTPIIAVLIPAFGFAQCEEAWQWQHPLSKGYSLLDVKAVDTNHIFAVGSSGSILKSTNGGKDWESKATELTYNRLTSLDFSGKFNGWAVGEDGTVIHTKDGGSDWHFQETPADGLLRAIDMVNDSTGWVVGDSGILKTQNGGKDWQQNGNISDTLNDVYFVSEEEGWVVGNNGMILHTSDGGANWVSQSTGDIDHDLNGVQFLDSTRGWMIGKRPRLLKTTDGGANWKEVGHTYAGTLTDILFVNDSVGWISSANMGQPPTSGAIYFTNDGGDSFQYNVAIRPMHDLDFRNRQGWMVGDGWNIKHYTDNYSKEWNSQISPYFPDDFDGCYFPSPDIGGFVGWTSKMQYTFDGGKQWNFKSPGSGLKDAFFIDNNNGYFVGESGRVLHSTNSGKNWKLQNTPVNHFLNAVHFEGKEDGWSVGGRGTILHTSDGGNNWQVQMTDTLSHFNAVHFEGTDSGWVAGASGLILHTTDGGQSWQKQVTGISYNLNDIHFTGPDTGWAVGDSGLILHTKDGGNSWGQQNSKVATGLRALDFKGGNEGWIAGNRATILHTTNGGRDWGIQYNESGLSNFPVLPTHFTCIEFSGNAGWVGGRTGTILKYGPVTPEASIYHSTDGLQVSFTNTSANDSGQVWHFGDGDTSHQARPEHTYDSSGVYEACLVVANACGKDTACQSIEMNSTGDVNHAKQPENLIVLYPNPAKDRLHIDLKSSSASKIHVLNGIGQTIQTINDPKISLTLNISQWEDGVYIIRALDKEHQSIGSKKLIKQ